MTSKLNSDVEIPAKATNLVRQERKTMAHLPKRKPVDIEFRNVSYSVSEGRNKGECVCDGVRE